MKKIEGTFTALVTPFSEDGKALNESAFQNLIKRQIQEEIDGVIVLGSTGEAPTLTKAEQESLIKLTVQTVAKKALVIVGTGCFATEASIENTKRAKKLGADMALVVTPYYNRPMPDGIFRHFEAIAKNTELPLIVYNVPTRTGRNIDTSLLKRIASIENIVAIKECSGSLEQIMDMIQMLKSYRPDFSVLSGDDSLNFALLSAGGQGTISAVSNVILKPMISMVKACLNKEFERAKELHYQMLPLIRALFLETNPIAIKKAMQLMGMATGPLRLPLTELSYENEQSLKKALENASLI